MENPFQNEVKLKPVAVISRVLKIQTGFHIYSDIQMTFPIFKEMPNYLLLKNLLTDSNRENYGIIQGNKVIVFKIGNTEEIAETNYAGEK